MRVFHYAHLRHWENIKREGLIPYIPFSWGINIEPAIYTLFSPEPENWVNNRYYPGLWADFLNHMRDGILLEIEDEGKGVVADYGYMAGIHMGRNDQDAVNAQEAYKGSFIPVMEYIERAAYRDIHYKIPEILIFDRVRPEYLAVCAQQPALENHIPQAESFTLFHLSLIPELTYWRTGYERDHGSLEAMSRQYSGGNRLEARI
jgi:hypothetical protein